MLPSFNSFCKNFLLGDINPTKVEAEIVPATILNMEFFDRIFTNGLLIGRFNL